MPNEKSATVSIIDTADDRVQGSFPVGQRPRGIVPSAGSISVPDRWQDRQLVNRAGSGNGGSGSGRWRLAIRRRGSACRRMAGTGGGGRGRQQRGPVECACRAHPRAHQARGTQSRNMRCSARVWPLAVCQCRGGRAGLCHRRRSAPAGGEHSRRQASARHRLLPDGRLAHVAARTGRQGMPSMSHVAK